MRSLTWMSAVALATAGVGAAVLATGVPAADAHPGKHPIGDPAAEDDVRPLRPFRGPFFGLRVNSMDVKAEGKAVAFFEYRCRGLLPGEEPRTYQFVRTEWRGDVERNAECDEVLGLPFREGLDVQLSARVVTSRWMRDVGPNGRTPVGGFVGGLKIDARVTDRAGARPTLLVPLLHFRLIGTTGLRPGRGDLSEPLAAAHERCSAPLHDEGWYEGGFDRFGLRALGTDAIDTTDARGVAELLRRLGDSVIVGSFEGQLELAPEESPPPWRYSNLSRGAWWFDGLLAFRCRREKPEPEPTDHGARN